VHRLIHSARRTQIICRSALPARHESGEVFVSVPAFRPTLCLRAVGIRAVEPPSSGRIGHSEGIFKCSRERSAMILFLEGSLFRRLFTPQTVAEVLPADVQ
jgi:hypothetical protein